jgi:hypothetical protein
LFLCSDQEDDGAGSDFEDTQYVDGGEPQDNSDSSDKQQVAVKAKPKLKKPEKGSRSMVIAERATINKSASAGKGAAESVKFAISAPLLVSLP